MYTWWAQPLKLVAYFILPIFCLLHIVAVSVDLSSVVEKQVYLGADSFFIGILMLVAIIFGALTKTYLCAENTGINGETSESKTPSQKTLTSLSIFTLLITIGAYAIWFGEAVLNPDLLINVLMMSAGAMYDVREEYSTIGGITTLTQIGILYVSLYVYQRLMGYPLKSFFKYGVYLVVFLALFRTVFWSERLAIIEITIPLIVYKFIRFRAGKFKKSIVVMLPYFGIIFLFMFFGVFEYFRSWVNHYNQYYNSYVQFIIDRVSAYYLLALNSGYGLVAESKHNMFDVFYLNEWFYRLPVLKNLLITRENVTGTYLTRFADEEFNNMSGLYTIYYDLGPFSILLMFIFGYISQSLYIGYRKYSFYSVLLFPVFFLSVLELLRINYWFDVRVIPIYLFVLIIYIFQETKKLVFWWEMERRK